MNYLYMRLLQEDKEMNECEKGDACCQNGATMVSEETMRGFIQDVQVQKFGQKTTVVCATLQNGFEVIGHSACVDPAKYSEEIGKENAMKMVENQVWHLLGFDLQNRIAEEAAMEEAPEAAGACA